MSPTNQFITTIICGTDGSADAQNAVEHAARLAVQLDAQVVLVHAIGLLEHLPLDTRDPDVAIADWVAERLATDWSEPLRRLGVTHRCVAEEGPPLLALPRVADRVDAELIVVASHGRGASSALPLGSTAHGIVQVAMRPVLVIPGGGVGTIGPVGRHQEGQR